MTIQLWPAGKKCNLNCKYCYNLADTSKRQNPLQLDRIKSKVEQLTRDHEAPLVLSGGEPLLSNKSLLEELLSYSHKKFGQSQIQTNGTLVDVDHVNLFKRYNTSVGVSIDGPGELNDLRWADDVNKTREMTEKAIENIHKLKSSSINIGLSVVLHHQNAGTKKRLSRLVNFLLDLAAEDIRHVLFHLGIFFDYYSPGPKDHSNAPGNLSLSRLEDVFRRLAKIQVDKKDKLSWKPFQDQWKLLQGKGEDTKCTWNPCDPWRTKALRTVAGDGTVLLCPAVGPGGLNPLASQKASFQRERILQQTPQDQGGCKNCRFYVMCLGHCPAAGQNNDPRNKSVYCEVFKSIFEYYEEELTESGKVPLSQKQGREEIRKKMLEHYKNGRRVKLHEVMSKEK